MSETTLIAPEANAGAMNSFVADSPAPPKEGEIVEGTVSALGRARVYIDLHPFGTGLIYGREYMNARDILRKVSVGDSIAAKVVSGVKLSQLSKPKKYFHLK